MLPYAVLYHVVPHFAHGVHAVHALLVPLMRDAHISKLWAKHAPERGALK